MDKPSKREDITKMDPDIKDPMNMLPDEPHIYLGSLDAVDDLRGLELARISHILTILDYDHCDWEEYKKFKRLYIKASDLDSTKIIQHFETTNEFLDSAISSGGTVLVHCAYGVSRSSALVMAFLMSRRGKSYEEALKIIRKGREMAEPNAGFRDQLTIYEKVIEGKTKLTYEDVLKRWGLRKGVSEKRDQPREPRG